MTGTPAPTVSLPVRIGASHEASHTTIGYRRDSVGCQEWRRLGAERSRTSIPINTFEPMVVAVSAQTASTSEIKVPDPLHGAHLQAALADLDGAVDEARDEKFEMDPSETAIKNARRVLRSMNQLLPIRFEVYPMRDGAVTIAALGGSPRQSVLVLCDGDGGALCSVNVNGHHRRAVYDSAANLPDAFVRAALAELENQL